ncbi:MAG: glycosyltransferase family 4 protein [Pyrinomonadaceae bacterium]
MKVLITAPSLDENENVSGISTVVRQIIEHGGIEYAHFLAGKKDGVTNGVSWFASQAVLPFKFLNAIRSEKPDVVHINTAMTDRAIWRDAALAALASAVFRSKPIIISIHGGRYLLNDFENKTLAAVAEQMLRRARVVIVLSENEKTEVLRRWKNLDVRILPNAVPVFERGELERRNPNPLIIFLGRLHESKGLNEIVKACRSLHESGFEFRCECYGDGPQKEVFVDELTKILGDEFYYGGIVIGKEKLKKLTEADVFLLPSIYGEGLPMALLEAMAAGCIAVASEMASVASVIRDGFNGYLIEPGNTGQLIGRLKMILDSRIEWPEIQKNAVETVRTDFAIGDYIKKLEAIYSEIAA